MDCRVAREDNVLPMIPAGGTVSGMMGQERGAIMAKEHQVLVIAKIQRALVHVYWHSLTVVVLMLQR